MNHKTAKLISQYNAACPSGISDRVMKRAWGLLSKANKDRSRRAMTRFLTERKKRRAEVLETGRKIRAKSNKDNALVAELETLLPEIDG